MAEIAKELGSWGGGQSTILPLTNRGILGKLLPLSQPTLGLQRT